MRWLQGTLQIQQFMISCLLSLKSRKTSNYLECSKWFNIYGLEKELELKFSLGSELAPSEYRRNLIRMHKLVLITYISKIHLFYLIRLFWRTLLGVELIFISWLGMIQVEHPLVPGPWQNSPPMAFPCLWWALGIGCSLGNECWLSGPTGWGPLKNQARRAQFWNSATMLRACFKVSCWLKMQLECYFT